MKKKIIPILVAALIIAQIVSLTKINNLQSQLNNAMLSINNISNNTRNEINSIYANVDAMLKKEASLIEIASTELGALDTFNFTIPVTFTLTPKEVSEYTAVSLEIDGEIIPMDKTGTTFTATVSRDIFGSVSPLIMIDENSVTKTTQDDRIMIWSMKASLLPSLHARLNGQATYGGGTYKRKGTLNADTKKAESGIVFTEMRFVIKVDEEVISNEVIPADKIPYGLPVDGDIPLNYGDGWQIDKTIPLNDGQICIMTVIATDSIGLEHHFIVDYWVGAAKAQREPWFIDEQIYSVDGKLLWDTEYKLVE